MLRTIFALFIYFFVVAVIPAQELYGLRISGEGPKFNVVAGNPWMSRASEVTHFDSLCCRRGKLIHYLGDRESQSLTYSLEGDKPIIALKREEGFSDEWDLSELTEKRSGGAIRAAKGKFKGWYLDFSEKEVEVVDGGKTYHVRQLMLVQEPKSVRKFWKYPISP